MALITEFEARQRNLSGCDVFKRTQLAYKDNFNRDHFVVSLNIEALKIFNLSVTLGQHRQLKIQSEQTKKELLVGTFDIHKYQISVEQWRLMKFINLEFFYIATGFELHFKSWLLQNDYVVNVIDKSEPFKNLKNEQFKRPITKEEFFNFGSFKYDTIKQINILQGITEQSLSFNTICNETDYANALTVSSDIIGMVEDYRNLRNQIHLPGDICDTPNITRIGENATDKLIDFINERVVENSNRIIKQYKFNFENLQKL
ncbi:hypothetical protein [Flavobacterium sp.]|uniref:hypothetical protein n=1 Tax=Flavobacterium sp. TaxID=239 RepID=UPI00333EDF16